MSGDLGALSSRCGFSSAQLACHREEAGWRSCPSAGLAVLARRGRLSDCMPGFAQKVEAAGGKVLVLPVYRGLLVRIHTDPKPHRGSSFLSSSVE